MKADQPLADVLEEIAATAPEAIHSYSADLSRTFFSNAAFQRLFDLSADEAAGAPRAWIERIPDPDREEVARTLRQLIPSSPRTLRHLVKPPGRAYRVVESVFRLNLEKSRKEARIDIFSRDITAERALDERERLLTTALDHLMDGFAITDSEGYYTFMNNAHARLFGYERGEELVGRKWSVLYRPTERQFISRAVLPVLEREGRWQGEVPGLRRDGSVFHQTISLQRLEDGRMICSCRDDSDRRRAAAYVERSNELTRALLSEAPMPVVLREAGGGIVHANPAGRALLRRAAGVGGHTGVPFLPPALRPPGESLPLGDQARAYEATISTSGEELNFSCFTFVLPAESTADSLHCLLAIDITKQRQGERDVRMRLEHQQAYLRMQRQLIASVSHEFRTPLAAIQNASYLITKFGLRDPSPKCDKWVAILNDATEGLRHLVDSVLELNQLELSAQEARLAPVDLRELLESLADRHNAVADSPRVKVVASAGDARRAVDRALLRRALDNLLANALKYSPPHEPVELGLEPAGDRVMLTVRDHGVGIPAAELEQVFLPFYRASNAGNVAGTGLGLAIAKRAAELHGGTLTCHSTPNVGTEFILDLPATPVPDTPTSP
jgi:PAS domain S-box-containing protein